MILLRGVLNKAGHDEWFARRGYLLLAEVQQREPAIAEAVIRHPSVGAWALRTLRGDDSVPGAEPGGLSAIAASAAIKAGIAAEIEVPVTNGRVMLPALGAAAASGVTAMVRTSPATLTSAGRQVVISDGAAGWQGLREITVGSLSVLVDDLDPFRMPAADGLAARLTTVETAEIGTGLDEAWPVLDSDAAAEVAAAVRVIVPCQAPLAGHVSSSSPETFGAVAISRQPDRYTCAVALVHEVQHLKLSALLDLVPMTLPDDGRRYYVPWRTDPRPAASLLQGAYAFLGVSRFWRRQRRIAEDAAVRHRADVEFARWRVGATRVVRTLRSSERLTPAGRKFTGEMAHVLDAWQDEPVPDEALAIADGAAAEHVARWQALNGVPVT